MIPRAGALVEYVHTGTDLLLRGVTCQLMVLGRPSTN